jgi:hypothetical protein
MCVADGSFDYLGVSPELRAELTALCTEYVWRLDNGHAARVPELFTEDGAWEGPWGMMRGRAELETAWNARAQRAVRTRHMLTNLRFLRHDADRASGQVGQIVFVAEGDSAFPTDPTIIAENIDQYRRGSDGVWRFESRRIAMLADKTLKQE